MKIQAYKVPQKALDANRMPTFGEMAEGSVKMVPMKIRSVASFGYHVAEDIKGNVYLINDDEVMLKKLNERNIGVSEIRYLLDGAGKELIKQSKSQIKAPVQKIQEEEKVIEKVEINDIIETEEIEEIENE